MATCPDRLARGHVRMARSTRLLYGRRPATRARAGRSRRSDDGGTRGCVTGRVGDSTNGEKGSPWQRSWRP